GWRKLPFNLKSGNYVIKIIADDAGTLWVGTGHGLVKYRDGQQSLYGAAQGLSDEHIQSLCQDRDGNLWIGTWDGGVCKLAGQMIVSFAKAEGLAHDNVTKITESRDGRIIASLQEGGLLQLAGGRAVSMQNSLMPPLNRINQIL